MRSPGIIDRGAFFGALASSALLFLSFPKYGTGLLAWIALVPLLLTLAAKNVRQALLAGFITGFFAFVGIIYWIAYVVVNYGYLPIPVGIAAMLLLAAYLALYVAAFAAGVVYFENRGIPRIITAPLLWTCLEYARSHLLTGFPWENLGYSQYLFQHIVQIADIAGVFGLSFIIVLINVILADSIAFVRSEPVRREQTKKMAAEWVIGCLLLAGIFGYGMLRISHIEKSLEQAPELPVSLIQGNIDQNIKWHPSFQEETIRIYKTLTLTAAKNGAGLIVWPETAVPFFFQDNNEMHRDVVSLPIRGGYWMLLGSPSYQGSGSDLAFLNSAFLISPEGQIAGQYNKVHLVPYGEYVPLRRFFPFINKLVEGIGDFRSGTGYGPLTIKFGGVPRKLGVMICYEGILPEAAWTYCRWGAELLVSITNDAWFGNTSAPYQHLSMTTFRSIENRLYVVRAANTGISAIIDPTGRILASSPTFVRYVLSGKVRFIRDKTIYSEYGDIFVYGCISGTILIFVLTLKRKRRPKYD